MSKLDEIVGYAERHDFADEMDQGTWEASIQAEPMVTTSVRVPKSLLDWSASAPPPSMCAPAC